MVVSGYVLLGFDEAMMGNVYLCLVETELFSCLISILVEVTSRDGTFSCCQAI